MVHCNSAQPGNLFRFRFVSASEAVCGREERGFLLAGIKSLTFLARPVAAHPCSSF